MKLSCSFIEFLLLDSRIGVSRLSMAHEFSLCRIMVNSRPLSRTTFWWLEGYCLSSSEGDEGRSISQGNLCEMNGDINFTSSNGLWLGSCFAFGLLGQGIGVAEAVVPNFSFRLP